MRTKVCNTCKYGDWEENCLHCMKCKVYSNFKPMEKPRKIEPIYIGHRDNG